MATQLAQHRRKCYFTTLDANTAENSEMSLREMTITRQNTLVLIQFINLRIDLSLKNSEKRKRFRSVIKNREYEQILQFQLHVVPLR